MVWITLRWGRKIPRKIKYLPPTIRHLNVSAFLPFDSTTENFLKISPLLQSLANLPSTLQFSKIPYIISLVRFFFLLFFFFPLSRSHLCFRHLSSMKRNQKGKRNRMEKIFFLSDFSREKLVFFFVFILSLFSFYSSADFPRCLP